MHDSMRPKSCHHSHIWARAKGALHPGQARDTQHTRQASRQAGMHTVVHMSTILTRAQTRNKHKHATACSAPGLLCWRLTGDVHGRLLQGSVHLTGGGLWPVQVQPSPVG